MHDLGRLEMQAEAEIVSVLQSIKHIKKNLREWTKDQAVDTNLNLGPADSFIKWEPLGVVCVMGSWNYPFSLVLCPALYAIAAGNSVIFKPSELAPRVSKVSSKII